MVQPNPQWPLERKTVDDKHRGAFESEAYVTRPQILPFVNFDHVTATLACFPLCSSLMRMPHKASPFTINSLFFLLFFFFIPNHRCLFSERATCLPTSLFTARCCRTASVPFSPTSSSKGIFLSQKQFCSFLILQLSPALSPIILSPFSPDIVGFTRHDAAALRSPA